MRPEAFRAGEVPTENFLSEYESEKAAWEMGDTDDARVRDGRRPDSDVFTHDMTAT